MMFTRGLRGPLAKAPSGGVPNLLLPASARSYHHGRTRGTRGAGRAWGNAGRMPVYAKDGETDFPSRKVLAQKTNRMCNFVPRHVKKSSSAWIFKDRYPNTVLNRMAKNGAKPWALSQDEYHAIKGSQVRQPLQDRALSPKMLIQQLRKEEILKTKKNFPRTIPRFKAGDRLAIVRYLELGQENKLETIKGMCIGRHNCLNESTFSILNNKEDTTFEMKIPLWSPFIKRIDVLQKGTYKRSKAYHLRDRPVEEFLTK